MMKFGTFLLALILGAQLAGVAHAQMLDIGIQGAAGVTSTDTGPDASVTTDAALTGDAGTSTEDMAATDAGIQASFSIDRNDLSSGETNYTVRDVSDVRTVASLESYAGAMVSEDDRVKEIQMEDGTLSVRYGVDAKLFGFIPMQMTVRTEVAADRTVSVSYPWYSFLVMKTESESDLEARIARELASIDAELAAETITDTDGVRPIVVNNNDAHRMALIIERITASLFAGASAEAQA